MVYYEDDTKTGQFNGHWGNMVVRSFPYKGKGKRDAMKKAKELAETQAKERLGVTPLSDFKRESL